MMLNTPQDILKYACGSDTDGLLSLTEIAREALRILRAPGVYLEELLASSLDLVQREMALEGVSLGGAPPSLVDASDAEGASPASATLRRAPPPSSESAARNSAAGAGPQAPPGGTTGAGVTSHSGSAGVTSTSQLPLPPQVAHIRAESQVQLWQLLAKTDKLTNMPVASREFLPSVDELFVVKSVVEKLAKFGLHAEAMQTALDFESAFRKLLGIFDDSFRVTPGLIKASTKSTLTKQCLRVLEAALSSKYELLQFVVSAHAPAQADGFVPPVFELGLKLECRLSVYRRKIRGLAEAVRIEEKLATEAAARLSVPGTAETGLRWSVLKKVHGLLVDMEVSSEIIRRGRQS